ncbi:probable cysteine--tRNA ligase, mitochondrial [Nasonia vitripennis]|uniref:cysteine--tRNA ligase n=1 Tax=Nasonia vitripennis TaxID=7425 RepID=A0A7M7G2F9_NASVI|nr:probable cysteine--tRNA ligase, mitochondrial [Nasonia vitripennis]
MSPVKFFYTCKRFIHFGARLRHEVKWIKPSGFETNVVVYNPITKCKTPLILRNNKVATWYMCGPTVYDSAHIGHACTYVKFDIIRRILSEFFDINVVLVMGLTDIDDKIIKRANESGQSWQSITQKYEKEFISDMDSLNVLKPFATCKVTNYIPQIVEFVEKIVNKNGAYVGKDGSVYFDTSNYRNYGKLDTPQAQEPHPDKRSSLDFALWKASKENEPYWESPWGRGRPGWHIECSAIASTVLGSNIDIHSGGMDLAFPHHENEEAQSCCYHEKNQWINYWLHTGHLHLEGDTKMSKSLQNTVSIPSLLKTQTANQFRMLCLLSDYRKNVIFSKTLVHTAITTLKKIEFFTSDCNEYICGKLDCGNVNSVELLKCLEDTRQEVNSALADDFDTAKAMHAILKLISLGNKMIQAKHVTTAARETGSIAAVSNYVQSVISKLGISQSMGSKQSNDISHVLDITVAFRNEIRSIALAKSEKDVESLKACDNLRKNLSDFGVDIRDRQGKSSWTLRER